MHGGPGRRFGYFFLGLPSARLSQSVDAGGQWGLVRRGPASQNILVDTRPTLIATPHPQAKRAGLYFETLTVVFDSWIT